MNTKYQEELYDIDFNYPITLQYFDKTGRPKVILLKKEHIKYLVKRDIEDTAKDYLLSLSKEKDNE